VYIAGETQFNESFATTVEREGVRRWLQNTRDSRTDTESLTTAVAESIRRQQQFVELVQKAAADLQCMYNSTLSLPEKRSAKNQRQQQMRSDYARLKVSWQGYNGYDKWFGGELNNAQLATVTTYNNLVPAFASMLDIASGDLPLFYKNVAALAQLNPAQRQEQLQELLLSDATKAQ
jgi:predicted aminopeptidase